MRRKSHRHKLLLATMAATFLLMLMSLGISCGSQNDFVEYRCAVTLNIPAPPNTPQCNSPAGSYPKTQEVQATSEVVERGCHPETKDSGIIQMLPGTPPCRGQVHACNWITDAFSRLYPTSAGASIICDPQKCIEESTAQDLLDEGPLGKPLNWPNPVDYLGVVLHHSAPAGRPLDVDASAVIDPVDASWIDPDASVGPLECSDAGASTPMMGNCPSLAAQIAANMGAIQLTACPVCMVDDACMQYQAAYNAGGQEQAYVQALAICWLTDGTTPCPTNPVAYAGLSGGFNVQMSSVCAGDCGVATGSHPREGARMDAGP